ncbi:angiogenic factor with G patch and FHA domains 1 isoform X3 [Anguilla anguilla]|uniref:angiogenic factor with G patch and FHA domains 1 isoform X3 n=1 Tax=Anguilla anguilla TaxID=7936 RepID=UPI0015ACE544|nr:angiogenic factor with G patch and FHA domains 1 isoform X3 [Anguilla anguilla]
MAKNGEESSETEVAGLRIKVETLRHKLKKCKGEIHKLQKKLNKTERLQKNTEKYNDDLRKQVDKLSAEIHERKRREKSRTDAETQTDDCTWTESGISEDYYNYYYGSYYQSGTAATENSTSEVPESQETAEPCQAGTENVTDGPNSQENSSAAAVKPEETDGTSIADMIRATAEEAVSQTGFVFDENSGMYYDHSTSLYYDSASQLYYDANSGMYYYYDAESGRYQFHSRVEVPAYQATPDPSQEKKSKKKKKESEKSSLQDGKVEEVTNSMANMKIASYGCGTTSKGSEEAWPPCVRVTVVRSPVLQTGTLYIITADTPATIGREKDMAHAIRIPEVGVSKFHAEVYFDQELQCYVLVDQGSQNGTVINGNRILQPKAKSEPCALTHGDEIKMGDTVLSFHIHSGNDTCDGCEPGQVIAHLTRHKREEPAGQGISREDKELQRQKELKQMKVKYGLKNSEYEGAKVLKSSKYKDRAEKRRQVVGSEGAFHRDDAPASVHVEIGDGNKGRKMLEKMGWKKGEGLGKDGAGRKDPIQLQIRKSHAGLGTAAAVSVDDAALTRSKNQENWEKARERFADTCQTSNPSSKKENRSLTPFVKSKVDK